MKKIEFVRPSTIEAGVRIGRWLVTGFSKEGRRYVSCLCDCGETRDVYKGQLMAESSLSCGCYARELTHERSVAATIASAARRDAMRKHPKESLLDAATLRSMVNYCGESGIFTWKAKVNKNTVVGDEIGCTNARGYKQVGLLGRTYSQHRLAWLYVYGEWPTDEIDHKNRVRSDNRILNLRDVSPAVNIANQGPQKNNKCGIKNVSYVSERGNFRVDVMREGRRTFLGSFKLLEHAEKALASWTA